MDILMALLFTAPPFFILRKAAGPTFSRPLCFASCGNDSPRVQAGNETDSDEDIKIAGEENKNKISDDEEALREAQELEKQKRNGNVARADSLGIKLAEEIIRMDGEAAFGEDNREDSDLRLQRRLLLAFTATHCLEKLLSNKIIQRVAVNSFYNSVKNENQRFYDDLKGSGAFSFYTLCVRKGVHVDKNIGRTFAMLCGRENDLVVTELGTALFYRYTDFIRNAVETSGIV